MFDRKQGGKATSKGKERKYQKRNEDSGEDDRGVDVP
jgi:hypothetical protein